MQTFFSRATTRLALLLAIFFLCGCGVLARPGDDLAEASRDFILRLRWGDFNGAARHIDQPYRDAFLDTFQGKSDLHIVDVRLESLEQPRTEKEGSTRVVLEYYLLPSVTVREFRFSQEWRYQGGDRYHPGLWQIASSFPPIP